MRQREERVFASRDECDYFQTWRHCSDGNAFRRQILIVLLIAEAQVVTMQLYTSSLALTEDNATSQDVSWANEELEVECCVKTIRRPLAELSAGLFAGGR